MKLFQLGGYRKNRYEERPTRVFVTGATGYIGQAVVRELARAGCEVTGLTRWAERTLDVADLGARAIVGDLRSSDSFRRVAAKHDVLIHLAAVSSPDRAEVDRGAIDALLWAARQFDRKKGEPPRLVVYTSGCFVLGETGDSPADEDALVERPAEVVAWRPEHERRVLQAASEDVRTAVVRPGIVYGGRGGLIGAFFRSAEQEGHAVLVGEGRNRWSPVYLGDLARLYRLIVEQRADGIFHAAEETGTPVIELARAASRAAGRDGAVRSIPLDEARRTMGALADALALDQVVASNRSREVLGWWHEHPRFVDSADALYREWKGEAGAPVGT